MNQELFNIAVSALGGLGVLMITAIWNGLKDLQKADAALIQKVHAIETLVAGEYVHRDEFTRYNDAIFARMDKTDDNLGKKLDRLLEEISRKVDRGECEGCVPSPRWSGQERRGSHP